MRASAADHPAHSYCPWVWNDGTFPPLSTGPTHPRTEAPRTQQSASTTTDSFCSLSPRSSAAYCSLRDSPGPVSRNQPAFQARETQLTRPRRHTDFYEKAPDLSPDAYCPALVPTLVCTATSYDPFALAVSSWACLQLMWTVILLGAQLWQVARQMTTLEVSNVGRYGYMGGKPSMTAASQFGAIDKFAGGTGTGTSTPSSDDPASLAHAPRPPNDTKKGGTFSYLLKLLGLDRFTSRGKAISGLAHATRGDVTNPFDLGVRSNCVDFWTRGKELGVEYERLFEIPEAGRGGFRRVVAERKRREREEKQRARGDAHGPVSLGAAAPPHDAGLARLLAGMKRKMRMGYGSSPYERVANDPPV